MAATASWPAGAADGVVKFWDVRKFAAPAARLEACAKVRLSAPRARLQILGRMHASARPPSVMLQPMPASLHAMQACA